MRRRIWLQLFLLLYLTAALPTPARAQFWPDVGGRILSRDGKWMTPVANPLLSSDEDDHLRRGSVNAWDLTEPLGTPVYPMAAGQVEYAGCSNAGGYGCWALIRHADGYSSIYGHMLDEGGGNIWVKTGEKVTQWTVLGRVGWTGQTSFGPHVHWEIRHEKLGRLRNDQFFSRAAMHYCKFCAATDDQAHMQPTTTLVGMPYYASRLLSPQALLVLLVVAVALVIFFRPEMAVVAAQTAGGLVYRFFSFSRGSGNANQGLRTRHWLYMGVIFVAPALLCGSVTAFGVWMADEGVTPTALAAYWRYGVYPFLGGGYQSGAKYAAVWGMPCSGVGTLGQACSAEEIVAAGEAWQQSIEVVSGAAPIAVVVPRLSAHFDLQAARRLLTAMHQRNGLVVVDAGADFAMARRAVEDLTSFGLDGIAIDLEFVKNLRIQELHSLANAMAAQRKTAGLQGEGVLILWNVFHNIDLKDAKNLTVPGIRIVPIFTGYGSTATKVAGLKRTQTIFAAQTTDAGLMAFDGRWPVNASCRDFDTRRGYDCQNWVTLFADPTAQQVGWWVQQ